MSAHPPFHAVRAVMPVPPHHLLLEFDTGEYRVSDLGDLAARPEPLFAPFADWEFLRRVRVDEDGLTVIWPNGLDLDPGALYVTSTPADLHALVAGARAAEENAGTL